MKARYLVFFTCFFIQASLASTPVSEFWKKIDFVTDSGNEVHAEMNGDSLSLLEVTINGSLIKFSPERYNDLKIPVLNKFVLVSSSALVDGHLRIIYALEFPLMNQDKDAQDWSDMNIVHFVIENNKIVERSIWENDKKLKLLSRIQYSK